MKKIIVLENNGGRLANQLWHFASMYAYCLEKGYDCDNWAFFRYVHYFNFSIKNNFVDLIFVNFFRWHKNIQIAKGLYFIYIKLFRLLFPSQIVPDNEAVFLLPPTPNSVAEQSKIINTIDGEGDRSRYFCGWLFRNPDGLEKFHVQIREYFKPRDYWWNLVQSYIKNLRNRYKFVIGVHIRQGDYRTWVDGRYYFSCAQTRVILDDFLSNRPDIKLTEIVFVICSDETIEVDCFNGLNFVVGPGSEITDLYTLAETDLIIGSTSTYGSWASYYGNKPYIRFSNEKIDWKVVNNI